MQWTLVERCEGGATIEWIHCPPAFLAHLSCESHDAYQEGVVERVLLEDPTKMESRLCLRMGKIIWRHPKTNRTAHIAFTRYEVHTTLRERLHLTNILNVHWLDDEDVYVFLDQCSALVRLDVCTWRTVLVEERPYVGIPIKDINDALAANVKDALKSFGCVFGTVVSYKMPNDGTITHRSLLIPSAYLKTTPSIPHDGLWEIYRLPMLVKRSAKWCAFLGRPKVDTPINGYKECQSYHTEAEYRRVHAAFCQIDILNEEHGSITTTFVTPNGATDVTIAWTRLSKSVYVATFCPVK